MHHIMHARRIVPMQAQPLYCASACCHPVSVSRSTADSHRGTLCMRCARRMRTQRQRALLKCMLCLCAMAQQVVTCQGAQRRRRACDGAFHTPHIQHTTSRGTLCANPLQWASPMPEWPVPSCV
jgi:hypothetical protein